MERVDVLVIGAGQAGLAMSHHLTASGIEHLVLERGRIAERWRSERWDSLVFQFPNWMIRLPGFAFGGPDPDGFMRRDGIVRLLKDYALSSRVPVRCGIGVTSLRRTGAGTFRAETDDAAIEARQVVVATGPYQRAVVPTCAAALPRSIWQITANRYTGPDALPPGAVLVVGSGGSGWQIAEDLLAAGRRVHLSVGRHRRVPRRYRGRDFGWWQEQMGLADEVVGGAPRQEPAPLLTGVDGGSDADLRDAARRGITLHGSLRDVADGRMRFAYDLEDNLARGDRSFRAFQVEVDAFVTRHGTSALAPERGGAPAAAERALEIPELDPAAAGIACIVWAVGYRYDFGWIEQDALDERGAPVHRRGVACVPGLYFLGLPRQHKVKSAFLWGVGEDAAYLSRRILATGGRSG